MISNVIYNSSSQLLSHCDGRWPIFLVLSRLSRSWKLENLSRDRALRTKVFTEYIPTCICVPWRTNIRFRSRSRAIIFVLVFAIQEIYTHCRSGRESFAFAPVIRISWINHRMLLLSDYIATRSSLLYAHIRRVHKTCGGVVVTFHGVFIGMIHGVLLSRWKSMMNKKNRAYPADYSRFDVWKKTLRKLARVQDKILKMKTFNWQMRQDRDSPYR